MRYFSLLPILLFLFISCSKDESPEQQDITADLHPFESYLQKPDSTYHYEEVSTIEEENYTAYILRMVSGQWLSEYEISDPEWWHYLTIVVPDSITYQTGLINIGGGSKNSDIPQTPDPITLETALKTHSIAAYLHNVPNQPNRYLDDSENINRSEDALLAYGWRKFMEGGALDEDTEWLGRLPMTRAVVRAMDTITDFSKKNLDVTITDYVVTGASKRGWTAWTTGIFDDRVIAIAPAVIDMLNLEPSFKHHWRALGEWSPAIDDYSNENIMDWMNTSEFNRLLDFVDPYSYTENFDKPVMLVNAASDEFFLPDSWQFYWDDLPNHKNLRYIPNTGHSLRNTNAHTSLISFYQHILEDVETPEFNWAVSDSGFTIQFAPDRIPDEIFLWNAHNPDARDFRLYVIDRIWLAQKIETDSTGNMLIPIETPTSGFTAWFVESVFYDEEFEPFTVTSGVKILPDVYPFEDFVPDYNLITRNSKEISSPVSE